MIDLTPLDVRKKRGDFRPKLRGYDPEDVDGFLELVAERFEELVKENLSLTERVERYGSQLAALEGRESAVHEALVSAQKLREEVSDQTQREADSLKEQARRETVILKAQAETEVSRRLTEAEGLLRERQWALEELEKSRRVYLKGFRSLLERELEALEVEEARRPLDETPLDLNLRGWAPTGEKEDLVDTGLEEVQAVGPSGFETQRLEVPVVSEFAEETAEIEPEEEPGPGPSDPENAAEPEPDTGQFVEHEEAEVAADPGVDPAEEEAGFEAFAHEDPDEEESVEFTDDAHGEFESAKFSHEGSEETDQRPEQTEPDPSKTPQEPRWLFSLLKKEEGDAPEGDVDDGRPEGEV
jgi:cell division initiation protein